MKILKQKEYDNLIDSHLDLQTKLKVARQENDDLNIEIDMLKGGNESLSKENEKLSKELNELKLKDQYKKYDAFVKEYGTTFEFFGKKYKILKINPVVNELWLYYITEDDHSIKWKSLDKFCSMFDSGVIGENIYGR